MSQKDFEKRLGKLGRGPAFRFDPAGSALNTSERGRARHSPVESAEFTYTLAFIAVWAVFIGLAVENSPFLGLYALIAMPPLLIWGAVVLVQGLRRREMSLWGGLYFLWENLWRPLRILLNIFE